MLTCKSTRCRGRRDKAQPNLNFDERFRFALHFINRRPWEILAALQIRKERSRGESMSSDWALEIWTSKSNTLTESDASRMTENLQKPSNCFTELHQAKSFFVHFTHRKFTPWHQEQQISLVQPQQSSKHWKGNKPLLFGHKRKGTRVYKSTLGKFAVLHFQVCLLSG